MTEPSRTLASLRQDLIELSPLERVFESRDIPHRIAGLVYSELPAIYGVDRRDETLHLAFVHGTRAWCPTIDSLLGGWLAGYAPGRLSYDPDRPRRSQRNVALRKLDLSRAGADAPHAETDLFPAMGVGGYDQVRVLVCEGADLLAWVGAYRADRFSVAERDRLGLLVPALRNRLIVERLVADATSVRAALHAALEEIPGAAVVLSRSSRIDGANRTARALLERDGSALREAVVQAARGGGQGRATVVRLDGVSGHQGTLVVLPPTATVPRDEAAARVDRVADRAGLTPRQRQVLELLASGLSNRGIAATLGIATRTVEVHLDAIYDKLGVGSRAAALATLLGR